MFKKFFRLLSCIIWLSGYSAIASQVQMMSKQVELDFKSDQMSPDGTHKMVNVIPQSKVSVEFFVIDEPWLHDETIAEEFRTDLTSKLPNPKISLIFDGRDVKSVLDSAYVTSINEAIYSTLDLYNRKYEESMEALSEAAAKVTLLAQDIGSLRPDDPSLRASIINKMGDFIRYYLESLPRTQLVIKDNQDLIDCLGIVACKISADTSMLQDVSLSQFFTKITGLPMTKQSGKKILESSDGEMAFNFKVTGGLDGIE